MQNEKLTVQFSYDARDVRFDGTLYGWSLALRRDCNGWIPVIGGKNGEGWTASLGTSISNHKDYITSCIYVTNIEDFDSEFSAWSKKTDFRVPNYSFARGLQFTCYMNIGLLFTSFTYVKGSLGLGGFSKY